MKKKALYPLLLTLALVGCQNADPNSLSSSSSSSVSSVSSSSSSSATGEALKGRGAPQNNLGENGDTYTDTITGDEYVKENGQWRKVKDGDNTVFTVTFDLNGGVMNDPSFSLNHLVKEGEWIDEPLVTPVKQHSTFGGWTTVRNDISTKYNFMKPVSSDLTLYAYFTVNEEERVILTVDPNNGQPPYTVETFVGDSPVLSIPYKEGFNFAGWYNKATQERYTYVTGTMTIEAHYEKSEFNVSYKVEDDQSATIIGVRDFDVAQLRIPSSINGHPVKKIGNSAFVTCQLLLEISIPSSVTEIDDGAFNGCGNLQSIKVDSDNSRYCDVDGVLFSKDMKTLVRFAPKKGSAYTVPSSVTKLAPYSFYGYKTNCISNITLNEGLLEIGDYAFSLNEQMTSISFPSTLQKVGSHAFSVYSNGVNLTQVSFNEGLLEIGDYAFAGIYFKDNQPNLPSTLETIGDYAFANCNAIVNLTLPSGLQNLGKNVFAGCTGILTVSLQPGNSAFKVQDNILYDHDMKKVVFCPSGRTDKAEIPDGVTEIGDYAFYMCDLLKEYDFPSSLTKIGVEAFGQCYGLEEFTIPDSVTSIGEDAFSNCDKLTTINFGTGLAEIPDYAFYLDSSLRNLNFPSNVKKIGNDAFYGCSGLQSVTFQENGVTEIGEWAFHFVGSIGGDEEYGGVTQTSRLTTITFPNSLTKIGDYAFDGNSALTTVNMGTGVSDIGVSVFSGTGITTLNTAGNSNLSYEDGILYNGDKSTLFFALPSVVAQNGKLTINDNVTTIRPFAFESCKKVLKEIAFNSSSKVETIGEGAFKECYATKINFPASLRTIEDGAFYMADLEDVTFAEGVTSIGDSSFFANPIKNLALPNSLQTIGDEAFATGNANGNKLETLSLGTGLTSIGERAFMNSILCTSAITLPASLETLGNGAFAATAISSFTSNSTNFAVVDNVVYSSDYSKIYCYAYGDARTSLALSQSGTTEIMPYAFAGATKLTSLTLPTQLQKIGEKAFANCYNIQTLSIPSTVSYIGESAFQNWGFKGSSVAQQTITFGVSKDVATMLYDVGYLYNMLTSKPVNLEYAHA